MALFSQKKSRTSRFSALIPTSTVGGRLDSLLRNRTALGQLFLCVLAAGGMLIAVEAWKAPFPYRLGDVADHGITASIEFQRINPFETERARAEAVGRVPSFFRQNPDPLRTLSARLRTDLSAIAQAETVEMLSPEVRTAFGLTGLETSGSLDEMNRDFETLRAGVAKEDGTTGNRIDDLIDEFERFIEPLSKYGTVDAASLNNLEIRQDRNVVLLSADAPEYNPEQPLAEIPFAYILLPELVKPTGLLGKSWSAFPELVVMRQQMEHWLLTQVPATLQFDSRATQRALRATRENVAPVMNTYNPGDVIVPPGGVIDDENRQVLQAEYEALARRADEQPWQQFVRIGMVLCLVAALAVLNGYFIIRFEPAIIRKTSRLAVYLAVAVLTVALGRVLSFDPWRAEIIPLAAAAMVLTIAYSQLLAALAAFTLALLIAVSTSANLADFVVLMSASAACILPLSSVPSRMTVIKVGFLSAVVYFVVSMGAGIITGGLYLTPWGDWAILQTSLKGAGWCLVAGYLVAGSLPFVESLFGVVTDISLLEMSDVSHPLLQELVRRAPGTYNHSIAVASIGETAADKIGANGLLVRVGAYFHDIGKMLKPQYFIENVTEGMESRHAQLNPAMSTLIIIGHVKDGADLARQHNLPQSLIDFIEQHHGTTLVEYFYHEAAKLADQQPDLKQEPQESSFRYPGPKPQTREAGVMMMADAVESASRALSEPTPKRIESLVHSIVMKKLLDGQFEECSLTLTEIHTVEESLTKSLIAIYHGRIKYPEQRSA